MPLHRPARLGTAVLTGLAITAPATVAAGPAGAAHATAASTRTCRSLPRYPGVGYYTSLKVTHVSCTTGVRVMKAHHACRTRHRKLGTYRTVARYHYRCTERRVKSSIEYDASVTCRRGTRRVVYTYQQDP
ncbi:hypothetical protein NBH00_16940 [Paraconexibacter antarcticus]|uniref:Uncharacterized protein n=1 Tax=Paraconexibacter antarcticus TaxID=2949664 RepID=A0ABY5DR46_9ACTN|nr:hypothetical protein [Paraconexibacter antarcticus]UTI63039.1 hypothetical protein NBH00_16940 [Paraconexibacter antarcticus]